MTITDKKQSDQQSIRLQKLSEFRSNLFRKINPIHSLADSLTEFNSDFPFTTLALWSVNRETNEWKNKNKSRVCSVHATKRR